MEMPPSDYVAQKTEEAEEMDSQESQEAMSGE